MERYFQIARCFRDEDLRADRQPEFTQLDMEMSFVDEEDIFTLIEQLMQEIFAGATSQQVSTPFPRLSYDEAMEKYGSDHPDLRFGLEIKDISEIVKDAEFKVFYSAVQSGGVVRVLNAKTCGSFTRREIDELGDLAVEHGARGMAWIVVGKRN